MDNQRYLQMLSDNERHNAAQQEAERRARMISDEIREAQRAAVDQARVLASEMRGVQAAIRSAAETASTRSSGVVDSSTASTTAAPAVTRVICPSCGGYADKPNALGFCSFGCTQHVHGGQAWERIQQAEAARDEAERSHRRRAIVSLSLVGGLLLVGSAIVAIAASLSRTKHQSLGASGNDADVAVVVPAPVPEPPAPESALATHSAPASEPASSGPSADSGPEWFVAGPNRSMRGPYSFRELQQDAASGRLSRSTYVLRRGTIDWLAAAKVPGLFPGSDNH